MTTIKLFAFSASLRKESYNTKLLKAAIKLAPSNVSITIIDWSKVPIYNEDDEANYNAEAKRIKDEIKNSDGVIIATTEYNYSIPGGFKNLIDYVSRPYGTSPFAGKPISIIGANLGTNLGTSGTQKAQMAWRPIFVFLGGHVLPQPEVVVAAAQTHFDADGNLKSDSFLVGLLKSHLEVFTQFSLKFKL